MSEPLDNFVELDALLASLAAGTLDDTGSARLEELASSDLAARRRYLEKAFLIGALQARLGAKPSLPFAPAPLRPVSPSPRHRLSRRQVVWSVLAASVLFAAYFVGISWDMLGKKFASSPDSPTRPLAHSPTRSEPVATILGGEEVQWSSAEISDRKSRIEKGERLQIESGLVEVELEQGAKLVIEGPAEWSIDAANSATLKRGKLVASVPTRAIGFVLETPTAKIVDLGTEFGVRVAKNGRAEAYVFTGLVEIEGNSQHSLLVDGLPAKGRRSLRVGQSAVVHSASSQVHSTHAIGPADFAHLKGRFAAASIDLQNRRIAYVVPQGTTGNHGYIFPQGMDFEVVEPIEVHRLGIFDSGSNGIVSRSQLVVELWARDDGGTPQDPADDRGREVLASASFSATSPGTLVGGSRFKTVPQTIRLSPGSYSIIAAGFNAGDPNGNRRLDPRKQWTVDDAGGAILFSRWSRWCTEIDPVRFPLQLQEHESRCQYAAGTFEYSVISQSTGGPPPLKP